MLMCIVHPCVAAVICYCYGFLFQFWHCIFAFHLSDIRGCWVYVEAGLIQFKLHFKKSRTKTLEEVSVNSKLYRPFKMIY